MARTFRVRYLPLSDGEDHFGGLVDDPKQWSMKREVEVVKRTSTTKVKKEDVKRATGVSKGVMVMNPVTGEFEMVKENS